MVNLRFAPGNSCARTANCAQTGFCLEITIALYRSMEKCCPFYAPPDSSIRAPALVSTVAPKLLTTILAQEKQPALKCNKRTLAKLPIVESSSEQKYAVNNHDDEE